jgi:hypothetical protein
MNKYHSVAIMVLFGGKTKNTKISHNDKSLILMSFAASLKEGHSRSVAETFGAAIVEWFYWHSQGCEKRSNISCSERDQLSDQFYDNLISARCDSPVSKKVFRRACHFEHVPICTLPGRTLICRLHIHI